MFLFCYLSVILVGLVAMHANNFVYIWCNFEVFKETTTGQYFATMLFYFLDDHNLSLKYLSFSSKVNEIFPCRCYSCLCEYFFKCFFFFKSICLCLRLRFFLFVLFDTLFASVCNETIVCVLFCFLSKNRCKHSIGVFFNRKGKVWIKWCWIKIVCRWFHCFKLYFFVWLHVTCFVNCVY